ncbi:MAG: hypothetical protein KME59_21395 [Trichormus sp. ATA11-4-KO1]|jgi:hypothetical protein|nr:hypothetical protein [Trichormus sp. ATA11-4-KO1]
MTPEEIKELIQSTFNASLPVALKGAFSEFESYFNEQLKPINDRLNQFEVASEPEPDNSDPVANRLKMLEAKLAESEAREQQRVKEAEDLHFSNNLKDALATKGNVLHQGLVSEILSRELRNGAVQKDGQWYTKDGSKLSEAVDRFFGTPEGLHFLPSQHQNGTGTPGLKQPPGNQPVNPKDVSVDDMISDMGL